jgi:DNA-directed RNA polymerase subunit M/transcription elongation factor TFIIS
MATPILIVCPKCGKQIKAPENALGKKVRCKFCQAAFVVSPGGGKTPSRAPAKGGGDGKKAAQPSGNKAVPSAKPIRPIPDDEDDDPSPYRLVDISLAPRCPDCANEIEEGQVICLHCGYNLRTREKAKTRKVYDQTFKDYFFWLLPGIACALVVFSLIGFDVWYLMKINDLIGQDDPWYLYVWRSGHIKLWVVIISLFLIWYAGKFAVKRLILNPKPPEIEKLK